jgi:phenylacetate-CoA ligase
MRRGALWGSPPVPSDIKSQLRNMLHDRVFYLDTMGLNDKTMLRFYAEINRSGRCALFGHAHSLYELARFFEFNNYRANNVEAIIATSMMLLPMHRQFIETVFGMKVTDRYGCEEVGLIASECGEHNGLHINDMHVVVEGLGPDLSHVGKGKQAELVVTDLNNYGMPMIRYVVGDEATMLDEPCRCGRGLSMLSKISGRTADYLVKADGSRVSGISMVEQTLTSIPGIRELQIVQNSFVDFELYMVRSKDFSPETISMLKQALRDVFGEKIVVNVNSVNSLPKTNRGKSRFSICKI